MKQPHTEAAIQHTDDQQNTGNHLKPGSGIAGSDKLDGTRAGAENVEGDKIGGDSDKIGNEDESAQPTASDDETS